MAIDRGPWNALVDDDGSNLVGTIWNKDKIKTVILDPTDAALVATVPTIQTYVPVLSGPATAPTLGNGLMSGRYQQLGKMIHVAIVFRYGSTTTGGTGGYWTFNLPAAPLIVAGHVSQQVIFYAAALSPTLISSGPLVAHYSGTALYVITTAGSLVGPTVPFTWSDGAQLIIRGSYEIA